MPGPTRIDPQDRTPDARHEWLFADIGGTNARFGRWRRDRGMGPIVRSPADDFDDLPDAVGAFERGQADEARHAALAVAVRVRDAPMRMTNRRWSLEPRRLRSELRLDTLHLVNDFVAAAAGLPSLGDDSLRVVRAGSAASDHLLLIGPGTGLGAAALLDAGTAAERVLASEAGHMGFAGHEPELAALVAAAAQRWQRLSWERLLNGEGLCLFQAWQDEVAHASGLPDPHAIETSARSVSAHEVSARVAAGDASSLRAASWFSRLLGAFAGDVCLAFGADGGVWLTGGVLDGLDRAGGFDEAAFLEAFDDKGRYADRQRVVPVRRVLADDLAFRGLARITSGMCRAPGLLLTGNETDERN